MSRRWTIRGLASTVLTAAVSLASGCVGPDPILGPAPKPPNYQVRSDGACLQLGELQQASLTPDALRTKLSTLLAAKKHESARRLVRLYPDVAANMVRTMQPGDVGDVGLRFAARTLDRSGDTNGSATWESWIDERAANPAHQSDATVVTAQALLTAGKPGDAVRALEKSAVSGSGYSSAHTLLVLAESQRRSNRTNEGVAAWRQAVESASHMVASKSPVIDPGFWERAAYLKPVQIAWPDSAIAAWRGITRSRVPAPDGKLPTDAMLWAMIGTTRLERNESHSALAALKKAESFANDPGAKAGLAVLQAKAFLQLGQPQAAMTLLIPLGGRVDTPGNAAATALLGSLRLEEGAAEQSLQLLKLAVEKSPLADWPGRDEAQADLGLAYLVSGDAATGLQTLTLARKQFEAHGKLGDLARSWENEAGFHDLQKDADKANAARANAAQIEARE